jgi:hypothetical protein
MIETIHPEPKIRPGFLQGLLCDKAFIRALATQLVANQVEAHLDMIQDAGPKEYSTFDEVADCIGGAKESLHDCIEEILDDFCTTLIEEIDNVNIRATAVKLLPLEGIDADVIVSYNVK